MTRKEYKKLYYQKTQEKQKEYRKRFQLKNPNYQKEYYYRNHQKKLQYHKDYRDSHNEIISWRKLLWSSLRRMGRKKEGLTINILGYSVTDLKNHLESLFEEGMNWQNRSEWHIDHIIPVSKFHPSTDPKIVNALSNLRPMWKRDNIAKGNQIL